ncbi:hypothetical protein, partial [Escherichia coli]
NYDEAVIEHINDNMNDATRQIAAFQSQVQVQQDALLVVDRQMTGCASRRVTGSAVMWPTASGR